VIIALVVAAVAIDLFVPTEDPRTLESTSYGTTPWGYQAVYELLAELGASIGRFEDEVDGLPAQATAWWLAMPGLCVDFDDFSDPTAGVRAWVERGGVGVVFLPGDPRRSRCRLGGIALPATRASCATDRVVDGLGPNRKIRMKGLRTFADVDDTWLVRARFGGEPFVIERMEKDGALVLVADGRILQNSTLDEDDAALVAVDLVRAYGAPQVVEQTTAALSAHSRSAIVYLLTSPAIALLIGLALTGLLAAWRGSLVPPRTVDGDPVPAPTLQVFVASLATLYASSRDYAGLVARYRDLTARRLRRHLGLPAHASLEAVAARVERARPSVRDARAVLVNPVDATSAATLEHAVARLDALAAEVIG
jgi:hypothetical protein